MVTTDVLVSTDGNKGLISLMNQSLAQPTSYRPWPGFRHPCRNDGFSGLAGLVYNDEIGSLGTSTKSDVYLADLAYYYSFREDARRGIPGTEAIYNELASRFPGPPRKTSGSPFSTDPQD